MNCRQHSAHFALFMLLSPAAFCAQETLLDLDFGPQAAYADDLGDVNGDGFADLIVGVSSYPGVGQAFVLSGLDGSVIHLFQPISLDDSFGSAVAGAGDVDGDGVQDVIVGARLAQDQGGQSTGAARVYSGATGSILYTKFGDAPFDGFGGALAGIGDINLDGHDDFVVSAPRADLSAPSGGLVRVFSGLDGSLLYDLVGNGLSGEEFGRSVAAAGDANGDGIPDIVAGTNVSLQQGGNAGMARVISGANGNPLFTIFGSAGEFLGGGVGGVGDWNQDGLDDIYVSSGPNGSLRIHSGLDGSTLQSFAGILGSSVAAFGSRAEAVPDQDGDGHAELWIGNAFVQVEGIHNSGTALLVSGASGRVLFRVDGPTFGAGFGRSVSSAGDVNGDGTGDLMFTTTEGKLRVLSGAPAGNGNSSARQLLRLGGLASGDLFGTAVAGAGDPDGDGVDDVIIGSPGANHVPPGGGLVEVYSGANGSLLAQLTGINGDAPPSGFGWAVDGGLHVLGTASNDIVIGEPGYMLQGPSRGAVHLFNGSFQPVRFHIGDNVYDALGTSVALTRDVDGDTRGEYLVGAPGLGPSTNPGYARLYRGGDGAALYTFPGIQSGDGFGFAVGDAGDTDGDGFTDLIVGGPHHSAGAVDAGMLRVYSGATGILLHEIIGQSASALLGSAVDGVGDWNGDGFDEFVVGAPGDGESGPEAGSATVYSGADGSALRRFLGETHHDHFGSSVAGPGDMDGDGFPDLAVGAPDAETGASGAGSVTFFSGRTGEVLLREFGDSPQDNLGTAVARAGDLDGDGLVDVIVGGPRGDIGAPGAGEARVFARPAFLNYCPGSLNSVGTYARLDGRGSSTVSDNDLTLIVAQAVPNSFGLFFFGPGSVELPLGQGSLCIGGSLTRLNPPLMTDSEGAIERVVALDLSPAQGVILPGTRFNFQFWYRDAAGGPSGFNLSSAQSIAFE